MKPLVAMLVTTFVMISTPSAADAKCQPGYRQARTKILHKKPKRRLFRGKSTRGIVCLKIAKPVLRKIRRLYMVGNGRQVEVAGGAMPRNAKKGAYRYKTATRKDQIVCPRGTRLEQTASFNRSPKKRLVGKKKLRIYVPGYRVSSRVWVTVFDSHKRGAKSKRVRVRNAKAYTCLAVAKPGR